MTDEPVELYIGQYNEENFTLYADAAGTTPETITGFQYRMMVRETADASTVLATYTCTVTSGGGGTVTCTLTSSSSSSLTPVDAVWDLEETAVSGQPVKVLGGVAQVRYPVTR